MQATAKKHGLNPFQLQKRIEAAEARVTQLEEALNDLHDQIGAASASGDVASVASLGEAYTQAESDLHAAMAEWESLVE
jgi:predicted  nucleic acid-binding Zn-ribbon protein